MHRMQLYAGLLLPSGSVAARMFESRRRAVPVATCVSLATLFFFFDAAACMTVESGPLRLGGRTCAFVPEG